MLVWRHHVIVVLVVLLVLAGLVNSARKQKLKQKLKQELLAMKQELKLVKKGIDNYLCNDCLQWYNSERNEGDNSWLAKVNAELPCPCNTTAKLLLGVKVGLIPVDQPPENWQLDIACIALGLPACALFHPGADGCLRSVSATSTGAGQQCCYDSDGSLLKSNQLGAGTPDRAVTGHFKKDVEPFLYCCILCPQNCHLYKELRKGNENHCE